MPLKKVHRVSPSGKKSRSNNERSHRRKTRTTNKRRGKTIVIGLGLGAVSLVSAAVGAFLAVNFSVSSPLQQAKLSPEEAEVFSQEETVDAKTLKIPELSRPVNILVSGIKVLTSDLKDNPSSSPPEAGYLELVNSFEGLSDTMLLLRFDPQAGKLAVLSIPRDTRVDLDGHGIEKINRANEYGGPALTAATVSELLGGVSVDRYVRVNIQGIEKLIDALGGVTVNVPKDMKYNDFSQHLYIDLKKGRQHLDGDKAVQFLRFRYDAFGDISRVQRQQMLMRSLVEQSLKPATIVKIPKILSVIQSHIDTNLTVKELMALANFAANTERSDVNMMMLPGGFSGDGRSGISYWLPDSDRIDTMMTQHFALPSHQLETDEPYVSWEEQAHARAAKLNIYLQNSTDNSQAANLARETLAEAGYRRISFGYDQPDTLAETKIIAQSGDAEAAKQVRAVLGLGEVVVESTGVLGSDITIQIGEDWLQKTTVDSTSTIDTLREDTAY
ncbi:LCP family protein [Myxosarcina sp. GI1]|uniref:LCP family protein n=1 Tax=Myxosarcina sp. GI1 TaxID=1541065 RepID=UPI000690A2EB|nr:LCP family protein [Myxosarcina sp. GI1]